MASQKKYIPVSCALYDELELAASRRVPVRLLLITGEETTVLIKDIKTIKNAGEFLVSTEGKQIRLDEIEKCNGKNLSAFC